MYSHHSTWPILHAQQWRCALVAMLALVLLPQVTRATIIFDNFDSNGGFDTTHGSVVAASVITSVGDTNTSRAAAEFTVIGGGCSGDDPGDTKREPGHLAHKPCPRYEDHRELNEPPSAGQWSELLDRYRADHDSGRD